MHNSPEFETAIASPQPPPSAPSRPGAPLVPSAARAAAFTAALGAGLALAANADAGIIYSGVQNVASNYGGPGVNRITIDLNGALAGGAFQFGNVNFPTTNILRRSIQSITAGDLIFRLGGVTPLATYALSLGSGVQVGSTGVGNSFSVLNESQPANLSNFAANGVGFVGVRFTDPAGTHDGWIRLSYSSGFTNLTIVDWAYNDAPGGSILAGQTVGAIPEPASVAVGLLAAGAVGLRFLRRRRVAPTA